jgi:DNA-binding transcriptional LysR family regulator
MNINHLAIFHAVAEEGSISHGAERLFISQPAVSKQIAEFERSLGVRLFDRLPKGVRLTEAGEMLNTHARRLFAIEAEAEQSVAEWKGLERGRLRIGSSLTIGVYLLPQLLIAFHQQHPGIAIDLEIANTEAIQSRLQEFAFDIGLTEGFAETPGLEAVVFAQDELIAIAAPTHPLVMAEEPVTAERLCRETFVRRETGSGTWAVVERALAERELRIADIAMSVGTTETLKPIVAAGVGVAIVSRLAVEKELAAGTLVPIPLVDLRFQRSLHLLQVRGRNESPATTTFRHLLLQRNSAD